MVRWVGGRRWPLTSPHCVPNQGTQNGWSSTNGRRPHALTTTAEWRHSKRHSVGQTPTPTQLGGGRRTYLPGLPAKE
jgi:hypothetical protein